MDFTDNEFEKLRDIMHKSAGVYLRPSKKTLVYSRLRSRVESLGFNNFGEYAKKLEGPFAIKGELEYFVNAITTNETYFFRTNKQFDYFVDTVIPKLIKEKRKKGQTIIKIWSAACSIGCEPYSLAILIKERFFHIKDIKFIIYASDINSFVLKQAQKGVYSNFAFRGIPDKLKKRYFNEVVKPDNIDAMYEIREDIRSMVLFKQHNLKEKFFYKDIDVIFLRNVMIYFNKEVKQKVISLLEESIAPGGYLTISLSETLSDINTKFVVDQIGYYKTDNKKQKDEMDLVAVVSSTGGVKAASDIIPRFPYNMVPVIWVQHMPPGDFTSSFAQRLDAISIMHVKEAEHGEKLKPGVCYIAPGGFQIEIKNKRIILLKPEKDASLAPSGDILFNSLSESCSNNIIGIVMTGMGEDGICGLAKLHAKGAYIIGQDESSSVVYGMAKAAKEKGLVDIELDAVDIAGHVIKKLSRD